MKHIILITGGQRSGKSRQAEETALLLSKDRTCGGPVYIATAHIWDAEFAHRVELHQARRGPEWTNIEEERWLSRHDVSGRVVLIDCLTLWITNFLYDENTGAEITDMASLEQQLKNEIDRFTKQDATFIFVTNETGMGGVSTNAVQRRFTDLQGILNQYVAQLADEVILMVSGIAVKIK